MPLLAPLALALLASATARPAAPPRPRADRHGDALPHSAIARLGTVRLHRLHGMYEVSFSPEGRRLVTSGSGSLFVWDAKTGRLLWSFEYPRDTESPLHDPALTPDGQRLVVLYSGGKWLSIRDAASGRELRRLRGPRGRPTALAVAPTGHAVACGDRDGTVRLWDLKGGKCLFRVASARARVRSLAFTPDGKRLAILDNGPVVRVVDAVAGEEVRRFDLGRPARVGLAPDAGAVATFHFSDGLWLWDVASGKDRRIAPGNRKDFYEVSFSADGRTLLAADLERETVRFWDVRAGKQRRAVKVPGLGRVERLLLSPDGATLAGVEDNTALRLWGAATGRPRPLPVGHSRMPTALAYTPGGKALLSATMNEDGFYSWGEGVFRWDAATGRLLGRAPVPDFGMPSELRFSPGGRWAAAPWKAAVYLWETRTGRGLRELEQKGPATGIAFSPDGKALATATRDGEVRLWDLTTGKLRRVLGLGKWVRDLSWLVFSPDGRLLAVGEGPLRVHLWDMSAGKHLGAMEAGPGRWNKARFTSRRWRAFFSPDGKTLYACNSGHCVVWDVSRRREGEPLWEEEDYPVIGRAVDLSPDGRLLARFDRARGPGLWETASGQRVYRFAGLYTSAAFAPDGRTLATGYAPDCSVLVWDLRALFTRQHGPGDGGPVPGRPWDELASPDAARAYAAVWRLASDEKAALAALRTRLRPVPRAGPATLARLVEDLGSPEYATRRKAEEALREYREAARVTLEGAHTKAGSLEVRRRSGRLLLQLEARSPDRLREVRAVQALEYLGTKQARRLLAELAKGAPEARLTQEAKVALRRPEARARGPEGSGVRSPRGSP